MRTSLPARSRDVRPSTPTETLRSEQNRPRVVDAYEGPTSTPDPAVEAPSKPDPKASLVGRLFNTAAVTQVYHWLTDHSLWAEQNLGLLDHLGPDAPTDPKILDLGAGTGIGTRALARALGGRGEVVGLDFSAPMVELANRNRAQDGLQNVRFVQGDATNLSGFETDSVDYVVANSFLYLVPDAQAALQEARRVLRPGGRLVFMEPREEGSLWGAAKEAGGNAPELLRRPGSSVRLLSSMLAWRVMSGLEGRRTQHQLRTLFDAAGFEDVRFEPTLGGIGQHVVAS